MSRVDWKPFADRLMSADTIVLGTHINADGDGLGCEIALHTFLSDVGRRSVIINNEAVPLKYRFLRGWETVQAYSPERHGDVIRTADIFVVIDNSSVERLAGLRGDVEGARAFKVCIDHHAMVNPYWDLNCVDTDACASGQLIYELIRHMGGRITPPIAEALYVSFVTDTGHFRFTKTTAESHRIVADLMEIGAISPARVFTEIYERSSPGLAALTGLALSSLRFAYGGRFAWMVLTWAQVAAHHAEEEDTGDLVNLSLAVNGVQAGALFKEMPDGTTKVSLRSKGEIDVHALAALFDGGGHKNAAGILLRAPLPGAIEAVLAEARPIVEAGGAVPAVPARKGS